MVMALDTHHDGRSATSGAPLTEIPADELRPGDVVVDDGGCPHEVAHVDQRDGWSWPIAFDDSGWAIAVGHHHVAVYRAA